MQQIAFDIASYTDIGSTRELNEDSCLSAITGTATAGGIKAVLAVSDGMGGHHAGDVASKITCEFLEHLFAKENYHRFAREQEIPPTDYPGLLKEIFHAINRKIIDRAVSFNLFRTMGCTCVVGLVVQDADTSRWSLVVGSIGDSRCYVVRNNELLLATEDDSYVWELYKRKEILYGEIRLHPKRNVLIQALGIHETIEPHIHVVDIEPDDILLVCSDGLHAMVPENEIKRVLLSSSGAEEAATKLIRTVNAAGAKDNIAVSIAYCRNGASSSSRNHGSRGLRKVLAGVLPLAFLGIGSFVFLNSSTTEKTVPSGPYVLTLSGVPVSPLKDSVMMLEFSVEPYALISRQKRQYSIVRMIDALAPDTLSLFSLTERKKNAFLLPCKFATAATHQVGLMLIHTEDRRPLYTSLITLDVKSPLPPPRGDPAPARREDEWTGKMLRFTRGQDGYLQVWLAKEVELQGELNAQISCAGIVEILSLNRKDKIIPRSSSIEYRQGDSVSVRLLGTGTTFTEILK